MSRPLLRTSPDHAARPTRSGSVPPTRAAGRPVVATAPASAGSSRPRATTGPSIAPADVTAFLDHYGTAFATADLVTVSRCYVPPVLVVSAGTAITFRSHDEIVEGFRDVVLSHREWGLASLRHEVLDLEELTGGLVEATVRWTYHAARNRARFQDRYRYLLRTERGQGPRIQSVVVLDGGVSDDG